MNVPIDVPFDSRNKSNFRRSEGELGEDTPLTVSHMNNLNMFHSLEHETGLSQRDVAILKSLAEMRILTAAQIQRLHFIEGSALTQARRSRRVLERLHGLDFVHRFDRRVGGLHAGSAGYCYALSPGGQRLIQPTNGQRRRRPTESSSTFQNHVLAIAEIGVKLVEAHRSGLVELIRFQAEPRCWRDFNDLAGRRQTLKPDAFAIIANAEFENLTFVEVDLGTEGRSALKRKADLYRAYALTGREQVVNAVFPRVAFLAADEPRVLNIRDAIHTVRGADDLFVVGQLDNAVAVLGGNP
ncbi:MAG: replication-relaxation family protein [Actinomycetota bacterium]